MTREEAIRRIKAWNLDADDMEVLSEVIPELKEKENEDERIRKAIVTLIEDLQHYSTNYAGVDPTDMLAYLEKQKERGPLTKEEEYTLHRIIEYLEDEACPSEWISLLHGIYCLPYEKQKENIEKEYVFRPLAGTDITIAAEQAIKRANEGDHLVLAFNGAYIPVRKGCNANKIVDIYNAFIEKRIPIQIRNITVDGMMPWAKWQECCKMFILKKSRNPCTIKKKKWQNLSNQYMIYALYSVLRKQKPQPQTSLNLPRKYY